MKPIFHKKFKKFVKKSDKRLLEVIRLQVDLIIDDPQKGKNLDHPFRKYKIQSESFAYQKNDYRIAYTVNHQAEEIIFLLIDCRENFYEKLKQMGFGKVF